MVDFDEPRERVVVQTEDGDLPAEVIGGPDAGDDADVRYLGVECPGERRQMRLPRADGPHDMWCWRPLP